LFDHSNCHGFPQPPRRLRRAPQAPGAATGDKGGDALGGDDASAGDGRGGGGAGNGGDPKGSAPPAWDLMMFLVFFETFC